MGLFKGKNIKYKLLQISMLTTLSALLLSSILSFINEALTFRSTLINDLTVKAKMIAGNSTAALVFNNRRDAEQTLSVLRASSNISLGFIYAKDGKIFAGYYRDPESKNSTPPVFQKDGYNFGTNHLSMFQPVVVDNETVGHIYLESDLIFLYKDLFENALIYLAVLSVSLLTAFFILTRLQGRITTPILELSGLMKRISEDKDYSVRTPVYDLDEFRSLSGGFNEMLGRIQRQEERLELHNRQLEEMIAERTVALASANEKLAKELIERHYAQEALRQSEEKYRTIFENTGSAALIIEDDTTILLANSEFEKLSGFSRGEIEGRMSLTKLVIKNDQERIREYYRSGRIEKGAVSKNQEFQLMDRNGSIKYVLLTLALIPGTTRRVGSILDITERKRLSQQLLHVQKMEAIGQLAGGIAHDFNNILTAIIGYSNILQIKMKDNPLRSYLDHILASSERAANLTQALLAFSRKQIISPKPINLNEAVEKAQSLLARLISEEIELSLKLADKELIIMADNGQIEQVLMNLATNARDAMPSGGGFSISTEFFEIGNDFISAHGYGAPGQYALIAVSDTGGGMDEETREKIFEPFFTTKEVGKGTGLGLAIVYGIIKQHNGYINCYSEPGVGTTFKIYLPLIKSKPAETVDPTLPDLAGGKETILVAEDDMEVRKLTKDVLQEFGYTVIEAVDGEDAVRAFIENKDSVRLLVFDVIMPRKNGREAHEEIKKIKPDIRSIFMSGYTADIIHKKGVIEEGFNFIFKPVTADKLLRKVRELLDT
jgi:PAS domain S-box-containing protein